jgi:hypothetical protein
LHPRGFWEVKDRGADGFGQLVADREADVRLAAVPGELVCLTADIRACQDLPIKLGCGQLREREPEHDGK